MLSRLSSQFYSWARGWLILALLAAFATYIAVTFPALQAAPGGEIESLDSQIFYTPEQAFSTVASYGDATSFWIRVYLTWDVVNPILYTLTFSLLVSWLFQRGFKPESGLRRLNLLPIGAGLSDLLENISIVTLLSVFPAQPVGLAWFSTICTVLKFGFLVVSVLLVLIGLVKAAANGFKRQ